MEYQFKITTPSGELRRLRFKYQPVWGEFKEALRPFILSGRSLEDFSIQYRDEEGDQIIVNTHPEWSEALEILANEKIKKFSINSKTQRPPSKSPSSTSSAFSTQDLNRAKIESTIREVLEQFLITADSVVSQIPDFVDTFVEEIKKYQPAPPVDPTPPAPQPEQSKQEEEEPLRFAPNIQSSFLGELRAPHCRRFSSRTIARGPCFKRAYPRHCEYGRLHDMGLRLLQEKNYSDALECFQELVQLYPGNSIARYNLACTYSLLSTTRKDQEQESAQQSALEALRQAIQIGYSNLAHMENDEDLDPIRQRPEYINIVSQLKGPEPSPLEVPEPFEVPELESVVEQIVEPVIQSIEPVQEALIFEFTPIEEPETEIETETEPETVPQPSDSQLDLAARYDEELKQLSDMGFFDVKRNLELLERTEGDIFRVIAQLLD